MLNNNNSGGLRYDINNNLNKFIQSFDNIHIENKEIISNSIEEDIDISNESFINKSFLKPIKERIKNKTKNNNSINLNKKEDKNKNKIIYPKKNNKNTNINYMPKKC